MPSAAPTTLRSLRFAAAAWMLLWTLGAWAAPTVKLAIDGVSGEMLDAVHARLELYREKEQPRLTAYRIRALYHRGFTQIAKALEPFGYYNATVNGDIRRAPDGIWQVRYRVAPGPPVRVARVDLVVSGPGADDPAFARWKSTFPLKVGDRMVDSEYEQAKRALTQLAQSRGYLQASLPVHQVRVDVGASSAVIRLHMASGPRYRFGQVHFGKSPLRSAFLRRFLPFHAGEPFDSDKLFALQRSLSDTDYFSSAEVVPLTAQAHHQRIPVEVRLTMRPRNRYTAGIGYGTDTGARVSLGAARRWVNARGHRASVQLAASRIKKSLSADYRIPLARPATDSLDFTAGYEKEQVSDTLRETGTVGVAVVNTLHSGTRTVALNYQQERYEVGGTRQLSRMVIPSVAWQRVVARDRIFTMRGWRLSADIKLAAKAAFSATDMAQAEIKGKYIHPLGPGRIVTRLDLGATKVSDFERLPVSLRFFAGGDNSVRGYAYNSLGPTDSAGAVIGGKNLLVGSLEYDQFFGGRWGGAIFYDVGNAFNLSQFKLYKGAGVGLRVRLPFGLVRVDVANALSEPGHPWRLHISLGPDL